MKKSFKGLLPCLLVLSLSLAGCSALAQKDNAQTKDETQTTPEAQPNAVQIKASGVITEAEQTWQSSQSAYRCEGNKTFPVQYLNLSSGESFAILSIDGQLILMKDVPAASGVHYEPVDGKNAYQWITKGSEGILKKKNEAHKKAKYASLHCIETKNLQNK